ncbi:hypothetical protein GLOIN_2v1777773 [Rhizophagus irregularis DAOM 181602=DAOM 197198]|uniref:MULE transposase domain-containing protein n=1 Tax=Rhizophagus irregularis (strain DAOM 181602 / DAOM 197198 / MUCL 43194) TaxID=747089 RepID=A0A2P4PU83_RHIID|nr:hypothetical protein GLOIN_2v1777773 [Rhizophagus irregularis DAOM 181602=DAOM 197198]POG68934.1 hypothetical protein GLOIN_2v1777773 [Rhizophagus irregularis DAOM 181602=DAOM 197198]|eukprot:XP_025175800.1 hypothetical protein GLOIN_2v1777773 [Rhizophagus irregularis DAOM 181602=DAOM 197198]
MSHSPDHSHPIEDSEKLKRSEVVRELVLQEAVKNYRPPEIFSAVKEIATETLDLGECVKELRLKEVTNIKYKVRGPLDTHLVGDPKRELDIREAISFLKNRGYLVERYEIPDLSTYGFVFMHPNHLKNLEQHSWLSLIDSTHKTNRYDCRLFTLYIRNSYGCWDVGAHFFVSKENSETVAMESNAIKMAFPGLKNGEQECDVFFCTVHVMRTWMSKIYEKKTRQKMLHAMHKRTRIGCESLIQEAINECANLTIKKYILRNYAKNMHQWALWARQHSPLLLQVTSTNVLESYHSELKRITSPKHGLIVALDDKKQTDSERVAYEFRTKKISFIGVDDEILTEIHKFPFPVQQMIIKEYCAVDG